MRIIAEGKYSGIRKVFRQEIQRPKDYLFCGSLELWLVALLKSCPEAPPKACPTFVPFDWVYFSKRRWMRPGGSWMSLETMNKEYAGSNTHQSFSSMKYKSHWTVRLQLTPLQMMRLERGG
jgi:hypothetical protein